MNRLLLTLVMSSATLLIVGLWIPLKAVMAQELLALAWAESQARRIEARPWPWTDTWPEQTDTRRPGNDALSLGLCDPFDPMVDEGPLRFLVEAWVSESPARRGVEPMATVVGT